MKAKFLCQGHREQLTNHPSLALKSWNKTFAVGRSLCEAENFEEGIPYLGCAFEAAQILMAQDKADKISTYDLFASTASTFGSILRYINQQEASLDVYLAAIDTLERELRLIPANKRWLQLHLDTLHKHMSYLPQLELRALQKRPTMYNNVTLH